MPVQSPRLAGHRVRAADQNPASPTEVVRHLLERTPWQRCPGFFCSEQQDQPVGRVPGDSEVTASRSLRERGKRRPGKQPGDPGMTMNLVDDPDESCRALVRCPYPA